MLKFLHGIYPIGQYIGVVYKSIDASVSMGYSNEKRNGVIGGF